MEDDDSPVERDPLDDRAATDALTALLRAMREAVEERRELAEEAEADRLRTED
jgi:hypothetical protein